MRFLNLNVSKSLKAGYQCAHISSIHACKAVRGGCLFPCTGCIQKKVIQLWHVIVRNYEVYERNICIFIKVRSSAVAVE